MCNSPHERGIPSKRESSARVDYVPALCTHRPSLLPIGWFSEPLGLVPKARQRVLRRCREEGQTVLSRGRKSRNKVSVGEPAEGSLTKQTKAESILPRPKGRALPTKAKAKESIHTAESC